MKLVAIEGVNGCGKTTQVNRLKESSIAANWDFYSDPGVTPEHPAYEKLRPLARFAEWTNPITRMLVYLAAKCELSTAIKHSYSSGRGAILDRYIAGYYAYNFSSFTKTDIIKLLSLCDLPVPDVTIILLIEPEVALTRMAAGGKIDVYEAGGVSTLKEVCDTYARIVGTPSYYPFVGKRVIGISGQLPVEDITETIINVLEN